MERIFQRPYGICFDEEENLLVADELNGTISLIPKTTKKQTIILGKSGITKVKDGKAKDACFYSPRKFLFTSKGDLLVADGSCIRNVSKVSTLSGNGKF